MQPKLFHVYGPLFINSYGIAIAIGLIILVLQTSKDKTLKKYLNADQLYALIMLGICSGIVGGRALYLVTNWSDLTHWYEVFAVWQGGLSITGVILSVFISAWLYLSAHSIPLLPVTDRFAIYAPLAQAFGRLGCFIAGCCYGTFCQHSWAITYTHRDVFAPLYVPLHPTQLYSACILFCIFIFLLVLSRKCTIKTGQLTFLYLLFVGLERFIVDFWRGDRTFLATDVGGLSVHQLLSGGIVIMALIALIANKLIKKR
ncbi:MAG: prolipoprotein diacylglyceryl transferase [Candidatus Babeliales bacterium]